MRGISDNSHGTNDVVAPGLATLLDSKQVILLLIVEDRFRSVISRHVFHEWGCHLSELNSVMLSKN